MDYSSNIENVGGGVAGGLGMGIWILVLIVLLAVFRGSGFDGRGHGGYGDGDGCNKPCRPYYPDESNWEQEAHIQKGLCKIDADVLATACATQKELLEDGQKTRALIEANYIQDLRDRLNAKDMENLTLKNEMFNEKKFDQVNAAIAQLSCDLPKRRPAWAEEVVACAEPINFRRDFRRNDFNDCCGF